MQFKRVVGLVQLDGPRVGPIRVSLQNFILSYSLGEPCPYMGVAFCESYSYGTMRVKVGALTSIPNANGYIYIYDGWKKCMVLTDQVFMVAPKLIRSEPLLDGIVPIMINLLENPYL